MPRRRANPLAWVALAVVVLLLILIVKAVGGGQGYAPKAAGLAQDTAKLGRDVVALRTQIKTLDRLELFRRLRAWQRDASGQLVRAEDLSPPKDFRRANGYLITALGLRSGALAKFNPAVRNALSDRDLQVAVSQLVNVMRDFALADRAYELFRSAWPKKESKPGASQWVADPEDTTIDGVTSFVRELRKQDALSAIYNLTVTSVSVDPKPTGKDQGIDQVPFTKSLDVTILVENTGNQIIPGTTVAVILTSETDPVPQTVEGQIGAMRPKDKKSVTLRGLEPTAGGRVNLLRVTVGPAGGERNALDNTVEYKFAMRKP
jgi:hypothetical protein